MAATKTTTVIWNGQTLTAGAANITSNVVTLTGGYGASLNIKLTNGATGPTLAAMVQIQVSADNAEWFDLGGALSGSTANVGVYSWGGIDIPMGVKYLRLSAGGNTAQNVTVDADITEVTALA
jgi:hypothetical protein